MNYRHPLDVPMRYQWDWDSRLPPPDPGCAPGNCGFTCVTLEAQYYSPTGLWRGIHATRRLATNDNELSSSVTEQHIALSKSGVPNTIARPTVAAIRSMLRTGRRPIVVGLDMSRVPLWVSGHPFRGKHSIWLRADSGGELAISGDPNFNRTFRQDPTKGRRKYSYDLLQYAYYNAGQWALVPDKEKWLPALPKPPVPTPAEDELDAKRYLPLAICDVGQTSIYADPDRKKMLVQLWPGGKDIGLYAKPRVTSGTPSPLAPVRIDTLGGPATNWRLVYVGWNKVTNIRRL